MKIELMQRMYGSHALQGLINSGKVWGGKKDIQDAAFKALDSGECMLSTKRFYLGDGVWMPCRADVQIGEVGSYSHSHKYWAEFLKQEQIIHSN